MILTSFSLGKMSDCGQPLLFVLELSMTWML